MYSVQQEHAMKRVIILFEHEFDGRVNDHPAQRAEWLEFVRRRTKAKARKCFNRCVCNRVQSTRFYSNNKMEMGVVNLINLFASKIKFLNLLEYRHDI